MPDSQTPDLQASDLQTPDLQSPDLQTQVTAAVAKLYDTYPFPPEPLLDEPPPGYNWRWNWRTAYSFCTGRTPERADIQILDAGCGSGVGSEYLLHLNPQATLVGIDISAGTLAVAKERTQRSGVSDRASFQQLSINDIHQLPGQFDLINSVGVLHHMQDPIRGIQALAPKLAPGGLFHIFVYAAPGRWEISLMQEAIALLQGNKRGDYRDGVQVGRSIFAALPETNRLVKREKERWAIENHKDECFADMYVHPQETDYTIDTLFELIEASGLDFVGFSNPHNWQLDALIGSNPELMARSQGLSDRQRYRLIELLNPDQITHYEFFLARPPLPKFTWDQDSDLLAAQPERSPCMEGWPGRMVFNCDFQVVNLSEAEQAFLQSCDGEPGKSVGDRLAQTGITLEQVRQLHGQQLILLTP
jgi:SAM-dependent methyltransferase